MEKKRSKSDSHILETGDYYEKREYGYDTIDPATIFMKPIISQCIYTPFTENGTCRYCYKNIEVHGINKNKSIRKSPVLIETEPTSNDQSIEPNNETIRQSPILVDYKNHWTSWLWW